MEPEDIDIYETPAFADVAQTLEKEPMEQLTEFEQEIPSIINRCTNALGEVDFDEVISCLRQIMPPTCTPTERKFLDRIREIGTATPWPYEGSTTIDLNIKSKFNSSLFAEDFLGIPLQDLLEKKDE